MWPWNKEKPKSRTSFNKGGIMVSLGDQVTYSYITDEAVSRQESMYGTYLRNTFVYEFPVKTGAVTGLSDTYIEIDRVKHPAEPKLQVGHIKVFLSTKQ